MAAELQQAAPAAIQAANLPAALRAGLLPSLEVLVRHLHPEGLWLFGSWARGSASRRSDVDLLVKHGDAPFWRSLKAEAIPLLEGCQFP
jgi:hypothetical protein